MAFAPYAPYAVEADILTRWSATVLEPGDPKLGTALEDASGFINGHLAGRYALPLASVPPILKSLCVDIAIYNLLRDGARMNEDARQRFEDAKSYLRAVARGEISLPDQPGESAAQDGPGAAYFQSRPRVMGRGR